MKIESINQTLAEKDQNPNRVRVEGGFLILTYYRRSFVIEELYLNYNGREVLRTTELDELLPPPKLNCFQRLWAYLKKEWALLPDNKEYI